ncbi:AAA family [Colletotrichum sojae]|uniref:AAA family n=1 Tax=Colletotrichum sojae TaxID=2175907 RepID=A0A8H6MKL6_9PEZI|nr:AAA family [Colletotrichum sojae]
MTPPEHPVGSQPEFRTYHSFYNKDGKLVTDPIPEPFGSAALGNDAEEDSSFALVIKRDFPKDDPHRPKKVKPTVNSPFILQAFRDVIGLDYPTVASDFQSPFDLRSPFQMLVHHWQGLEAYRAAADSSNMQVHLDLLLQFMSRELGAERTAMLSMLQKKQKTYSAAWNIFRPGTLLYTKILGFPWVLVCQKTAYEQSKRAGPYLEIHATYTEYDGTSVGEATAVSKMYQKQHFGGDNPAVVTDLPIYPREYVDDAGLGARLEERGRKFLAFTGVSVEAYDGIAQYMKEPPYSFWHTEMEDFEDVWLPYTESGRIVIDRKTFQHDYYRSVAAIRKVPNPSPLTCPPFLFGFSLGRKRRVEEDVWDSLILEEKNKLVIPALITSNAYSDKPRNQSEQKGKGLVILLHGTPGSGKTLTAELAAEAKKTALIPASLGELNKENNAMTLERELQRLMQYATTWKAVLLLDEADVFLERREENPSGADRNALVAVFLKQLEYFSGVAFLTTNRLRALDSAMGSRVHLALGYGAPDAYTRRRLWVQCLRGLPAAAAEPEFDGDVEDASAGFAARQLNGREIANAVNTARTIARFEGGKLRVEHIERVLDIKASFQGDLAAEGNSSL